MASIVLERYLAGLNPANERQSLKLWDFLEIFFTMERVNKWKAAVAAIHTEDERQYPERLVSNYISLYEGARELWAANFIVLEPLPHTVSEDHTSVKVKFHWMEAHDYKHSADLASALESAQLGQIIGCAMSHVAFSDEAVYGVVYGTEFTLRTEDPVYRPLPDQALLEIQWFMLRLGSLAGTCYGANYESSDCDYFNEE
jgi:hypothetical protein